MIRTASKETVGECKFCQDGKRIEGIFVTHDDCTHCHGSGLKPLREVCPLCHGIGGFSQSTVKQLDAHRTPGSPPITSTRCPACRGNGYMLLRLRDGQQFESQGVLP